MTFQENLLNRFANYSKVMRKDVGENDRRTFLRCFRELFKELYLQDDGDCSIIQELVLVCNSRFFKACEYS